MYYELVCIVCIIYAFYDVVVLCSSYYMHTTSRHTPSSTVLASR